MAPEAADIPSAGPTPASPDAPIGLGALFALQAVRSLTNYEPFRAYDFIVRGAYLLSIVVTVSIVDRYQTRVVVISAFILGASVFAIFIIDGSLETEDNPRLAAEAKTCGSGSGDPRAAQSF